MSAREGLAGPGVSERAAERELVRRALAGEGAAFDRLMRRIEPDLAAFLRGALRTAPQVSVEDALQEVRIYLYRRLDRYDPVHPLGAFARGLARNVVKRLLHGRRDLLPAPGGEESGGPSVDLSPAELQRLPLAFRRAVGEGRFEEPGGSSGPSRTFLELFEVFLRYGGYPHQQVAFGYGVLLWGKEKRRRRPAGTGAGGSDRAGAGEKVPVTGDPDRVVREVGPRELRPASEGMLRDIAAACRLDGAYVARVRRPLEARLGMVGAELFRRDPASLERYRGLERREIGRTRLEEYFGADPRRSVADWTHGVKGRVRKAFLDPAARAHSPLPQPEGGP